MSNAFLVMFKCDLVVTDTSVCVIVMCLTAYTFHPADEPVAQPRSTLHAAEHSALQSK